MTQTFIEGKRVPVTILTLPTQVISQIKSADTDGYTSAQVAIGKKNKPANKPQAKHFKKAEIKHQPQWAQEVTFPADAELSLKPGDSLPVADIIATGDTVNVTGTSLGKGFSGVMKRYNFGGGPRTHGQSDRARAPGSIGRGTTPGRVLPGKKMPGHMGDATTTIKNLKIISVDLDNKQISVSGPIPGSKGQLVSLTVIKKAPKKAEK